MFTRRTLLTDSCAIKYMKMNSYFEKGYIFKSLSAVRIFLSVKYHVKHIYEKERSLRKAILDTEKINPHLLYIFFLYFDIVYIYLSCTFSF